MAANRLLLQFLTELVVHTLHWKWLVLIHEQDIDYASLLVNELNEKNVSMTVLSSQIGATIHLLLRQFRTFPVLLLLEPKGFRRNFLFETCDIQWLVVVPDSSADAFLSQTDGNLFRLNVMLVTISSEDTFELQIPNSNAVGMVKVNTWRPATGFETSSYFGSCPVSSIGHLRVAMEKHFPFYKPANDSQPAEGVDVLLLNSLASAFKFTYSICRSADGAWGTRNGSEWNGMIGMLVRNEADSALSGMTVTYGRQEVAQFTTPYAFDQTTFVTKKPAGRAKTWAIFWPYTLEVWISLATMILFMAAILTWLQTRLKKRKKRLRYKDSVMYIFQAMLNQGYYNASETRCRVLMAFWWGFCITLIAGYNGSLMSFMAHPGLSPAVDTIPKLVDAVREGRIAVGTIEKSADFAVFMQSEEEGLRTILSSMQSDPRNLVHHDVDGLRETQARPYGYVGGWLTVQADVWDPSLFLFAKDSFLMYGYAIAFRPGFEHLHAFDKKILQLREAGIIQKWTLSLIEKEQERGGVGENSPHSQDDNTDDNLEPTDTVLDMEDMQGAFAVLTIGLMTSIVCFILENTVFWRVVENRQKPKKRSKKKKLRRWR